MSDKSGLAETAKALADLGVELVSTGGTKAAIAAAGLPVKDVAELTGFPEMMDGRVKTLHPIVHGGLLGVRDAPEHAKAMSEHGIGPIDLLYVSLYPFEATVAKGGAFADCIENIDIGGPAMIRSASKNHGYVAVCTTPEDVAEVLAALKAEGATTLELRKRLAARAFARTAAYDSAIAAWFAGQLGDAAPQRKTISGTLSQVMRYGENPHQAAAFYEFHEPRRPGVATARQLQGKELSFNNIADTDAAFELIAEFDPKSAEAAVAIIKHANPCGVALGGDLKSAYERALQCDPVSAFGGIVAVNRKLDRATAEEIVKIFTEVVVAPEADDDAIAVFEAEEEPAPAADRRPARSFGQGRGVPLGGRRLPGAVARPGAHNGERPEDRHQAPADRSGGARHAVRLHHRQARQVQRHRLRQGRANPRHRRRADEPSRLRADRRPARRRLRPARILAEGSACASEAFFPFPDGLIQAADAGATAVIQPGGSMGDATR